MTDDRARQARKAAERPELRIISRAGEELTADALTLANYQHLSCNDYVVEVSSDDHQSLDADKGRCYVVMSPNDLVLVKPRDRRDHVMWLVERRRYEEALDEVESFLEADGSGNSKEEDEVIVQEIRRKYIHHLVHEGWFFFSFSIHFDDIVFLGDFVKAAKVCSKFCARDSKLWEDWIFVFEEKKQLQVCINSHFFVYFVL